MGTGKGMLEALAVLLLLQLAGEFIAQLLSLPIPGPVIGMALLFGAMRLSPKLAARVRETANTVLSHLSLLFVPAGVGVMLHMQRVADEWLAILLALVLGTLITLVVTALSIKACMRLLRRGRQ
jgi:holin-like protein